VERDLDVGDGALAARLHRVDVHLDDEHVLPAAVDLAQRRRHRLPDDVGAPADHAQRVRARCAAHLDLHVARDDGGDHAQLLVQEARQVGGVLDERVAAVAAQRQLHHQVLVVVDAQADRRHRDSLCRQAGAQRAELRRRARPLVRLAVGQQDDAVDAVLARELAHLARALHDAREQRGAAARLQAGDAGLDRPAVGRVARRDHDLDHGVVGDDRHVVAVAQLGERRPGAIARGGHLVAAHRSRAIDRDADVRVGARPGGLRLLAEQADAQVRLVLLTGEHDRLGEPGFQTHGGGSGRGGGGPARNGKSDQRDGGDESQQQLLGGGRWTHGTSW
jgi:hypothetical protein